MHVKAEVPRVGAEFVHVMVSHLYGSWVGGSVFGVAKAKLGLGWQYGPKKENLGNTYRACNLEKKRWVTDQPIKMSKNTRQGRWGTGWILRQEPGRQRIARVQWDGAHDPSDQKYGGSLGSLMPGAHFIEVDWKAPSECVYLLPVGHIYQISMKSCKCNPTPNHKLPWNTMRCFVRL